MFPTFRFPGGQTAKNRLFKSSMEEQLPQNHQPTQALVRLYDAWAKSGAGVLLTGNMMVAQNGKGSAHDVVLTDERSLPVLEQWTKAGTQNDS